MSKPIEIQQVWDQYYKKDDAPTFHSSFAGYVLKYVKGVQGPLMELGCGNGRDAFYFLSEGIDVWACDLSEQAIEKVNAIQKNFSPQCHFFRADFGSLPVDKFNDFFGSVYSRFTLHAVDKPTATQALKWSYQSLKKGGQLFIEARSVNSSMYGVGTPVGKDEFINGHYRRFIRQNELVEELNSYGFKIVSAEEVSNASQFQNDNPVLIRLIAQK